VSKAYCYIPGGRIHSIQIGDIFLDGQLKVLNKLGYGAYPTVWLVRDASQNFLAALKVLTSDVSLVGLGAKLRGMLVEHQDFVALPFGPCTGTKWYLRYFDFTYRQPNSLSVYNIIKRLLSLSNIRRKTVRDSIQGIAYPHQAGIGQVS
jgi:serine/threonine protein kinase